MHSIDSLSSIELYQKKYFPAKIVSFKLKSMLKFQSKHVLCALIFPLMNVIAAQNIYFGSGILLISIFMLNHAQWIINKFSMRTQTFYACSISCMVYFWLLIECTIQDGCVHRKEYNLFIISIAIAWFYFYLVSGLMEKFLGKCLNQ